MTPEPRFEPTVDLAEFGTAAFDQSFVLFPAAFSAEPGPLLLPPDGPDAVGLSGEHRYRDLVPAVAVQSLTGHVATFAGLRPAGPEPTLSLDTPVALPLPPGHDFARFPVDVLPGLFLLDLLRQMGRPFPLLLPRGIPDWALTLIQLACSPAAIHWFDAATAVVAAPAFILPTSMQAGGHFHPAVNVMVETLRPRLAKFAASPTAARISLDPVAEPLAPLLAAFGVAPPDPASTPLQDLAACATAELILASPATAAMALLAPRGARVLMLDRPGPLSSRIAALRGQTLGIAAATPLALHSVLQQLLPDVIAAAAQPSAPPAPPEPIPEPPAPAPSAPDAPDAGPTPENQIGEIPVGRHLDDLTGPGLLCTRVTFADPARHLRQDFFHHQPIDSAVAPFGPYFTAPEFRAYQAGAMYAVGMPGASLLGEDGVAVFEGAVVEETAHSTDWWRGESMLAQVDLPHAVRLKHPASIPGPRHPGNYLVGFTGSWRNYAHWITECLPRLQLFRRLSAQVPGLKLVLPRFRQGTPPARTLELLRIAEAEIARIGGGEVLTAETLWCTGPVDVWSVPALCRTSADWLAGQVTPLPPGAVAGDPADSARIYIHRLSAQRRLENFDALRPMIEELGFRIVAMETMTLDEQIRTMRGARRVAGETSAGLANVMFCRPGARLLEIFNPGFVQPAHWSLCGLCELDYGFVVGSHFATLASPLPDMNASYTIEPDRLRQGLLALLEGA